MIKGDYIFFQLERGLYNDKQTLVHSYRYCRNDEATRINKKNVILISVVTIWLQLEQVQTGNSDNCLLTLSD